eukprot:m.122912 g.122912  ORF g.122912 m.122912 type:complete len:434 (+) comp37805_c0_seq9:29-1330(+)
MDSRWDTVVRPQLVRLKQTLNPKPVLDGLYARGLVSRDEWQSISGLRSDGDKVMELLVLVLPRKGPEAYDGFLEVLKDTEGQKYIAEELLKKSQSISGTLCCGVLKEQLIAAQKKIRLLQLSNVELGRERRGEKTISLGLRMKQKGKEWDGRNTPGWEEMLPSLPEVCTPHGRVAEVNKHLIVGDQNKLFYLEDREWKESLINMKIDCVFECEMACYIMGRDMTGSRKICSWETGSDRVQTLTRLPDHHQLFNVSATGHKNKVYLVGGSADVWGNCPVGQVDNYDITSNQWTKMNNLKNKRYSCSLAVVDNKLVVGGGYVESGPSNIIECLPLNGGDSFTLPPTTKDRCEIAAFNGRLVAVGGWFKTSHFEVYDSFSNSWLPLPYLRKGRELHGVCTTQDDKIVVVGGYRGAPIRSVEVFSIIVNLLFYTLQR